MTRASLLEGSALSLLSLFSSLTDPRVSRTRRYPLGDILLLTLCGLLCGADNYVAICRWAKVRKAWLSEQFGISAIPAHDTLGRVLSKIDTAELGQVLSTWNHALWKASKQDTAPEEVIAFDGKRIKGAADQLNLLSAWASEAQLTLALTDAGHGADEQEAMRLALSLVDVAGCLVTADAMHAQVPTAATIVEKKADYLLAVKANQGRLFEQAQLSFDLVRSGEEKAASFCVHRHKERGPVEIRKCWTLTDVGLFDPEGRWPGLATIVCVWRGCYQGATQVSEQTRYFISSATGEACRFLRASRSHWGIENSQHWRLDVFFREDASRVRAKRAATNLSTLRRLALGLLKRETSEKVGVQTKRQMAGWSTDYLERVLQN